MLVCRSCYILPVITITGLCENCAQIKKKNIEELIAMSGSPRKAVTPASEAAIAKAQLKNCGFVGCRNLALRERDFCVMHKATPYPVYPDKDALTPFETSLLQTMGQLRSEIFELQRKILSFENIVENNNRNQLDILNRLHNVYYEENEDEDDLISGGPEYVRKNFIHNNLAVNKSELDHLLSVAAEMESTRNIAQDRVRHLESQVETLNRCVASAMELKDRYWNECQEFKHVQHIRHIEPLIGEHITTLTQQPIERKMVVEVNGVSVTVTLDG